MSRKTEADHIEFLLAIISHTDARPDWEGVAQDTGLYKSGKFVRQAFKSIQDKYVLGSGSPSTPATPNSDTTRSTRRATTKKRAKPTENDGQEDTPAKKAKSSIKEEGSDDELAASHGADED